ncbi:hypothetical protein [Brevibacterium gallinarum]|uniref:Uncharacterized protein n=1 Tax=Brevibacterium gallinarum TaxID=2762220 RepID=A0ABR8WR11_9MICO|nr:hypothetical protein [Brevibacterium gallinarum]MBD8019449.1 hypothetical protein [Brevibacterium gallinarum]
MWNIARLAISTFIVSGLIVGAGHLTRLIDSHTLPEAPAIAVEETADGVDESGGIRGSAAAEAAGTAAPDAAYLPTASGTENRPSRRNEDDDDTPPADGLRPPGSAHSGPAAESADDRVRALAADLSRAVANGHATPTAAERFLAEVSGYIRAGAHT